jgi:GNAT superfamily N-acetyltransferase
MKQIEEIQTPSLEDISRILKLFSAQDTHHYAADPTYYIEPNDPQRVEKLTKEIIEAISEKRSPKKIAVAYAHGELAGVVTYEVGQNAYHDTRITKFIEIKELFVVETNRNQGIATDLVNHVKNCAKEYKIFWLKADFTPFNKEAVAFWTKMKFIPRQISSYYSLSNY